MNSLAAGSAMLPSRVLAPPEVRTDFSDETVKAVHQNFYVDDCLMSLSSEMEAIQMVKELNTLCKRGGFILEKWISNSRAVLQTIPEDQRAKELKELNLDRDDLPIERALGLLWCVESDSFKFKLEVKRQSLTRRGMLSITSSVYDPLGILAPVTLSAKMMQQEKVWMVQCCATRYLGPVETVVGY